MKNKGLIIFSIVILIICILLLSGILFFSLSGKKGINFGINNYQVSNTKVYDKVYNHKFNKIDIETDAADIEIKKGSVNKVVIYGEENQLSISDDDTLHIKYTAKKCNFFCINVRAAKVEVYLTEDFDNKLEIKNSYGDIEIDEFENSIINIDSSCGDTKVKKADSIELHSSCGDVVIGETKNATIENNLGDININRITNKTDIKADCGDIEIKELDLKENSSIENNLGDISIKKTNDIRIDSKVSLGDNDVKNNNYSSNIILKIENSCGDINVN